MKVGDYVRTDNGLIAKVNKIIDCANGEDFEYIEQEYYLNSKNQIVISNDDFYRNDVVGCLGKVIKTSNKLIDLIQVGDYVNGRKVYQVGYNFQDDLVLKMSINKDGMPNNYEDFIYEKDIKSIVTKEQFESMEYKVGE